ncbi:MAG TPA: hypothetical protein VEM15_17565 [Thermodesulfobacteriota bacterium]|nr:hypothetical protein [Thermodesulfobacteriota bacterium]
MTITLTGETVEKVPKQILGGDAEKNDLTECATIDDVIIRRGHETPPNHPLTVLEGFSTVSEEALGKRVAGYTYESWF